MEDNVSILLASILTVVIIVLFPIYNVATRQDSIAKNMVVKATTNFVDEARNKGYIEEKDYENYLMDINKTGNSYEVQLEVYKPILVETDDADSYEEKYTVDYTNDIISKMGTVDLDTANAEMSVIKNDVYYLNDGYKFYVRVKNTNITQAQVLLDRLLKGEVTERIVVNYGGVVYNNEWTKGEDAETVGANISISRPLDYSEKEFKYEAITDVYDQYLDEMTTIYGLAVKLSDDVENGNKFKFLLKYKDVYELKDEAGNVFTTKYDREQYIKRYFSTIGFDAKVSVEERQVSRNNNGTYNYQYMITLSDIDYDFSNHAYLNGTVQIKAGSADTKSGTLGLLNSKEFIIIYEATDLEIKYQNKMYDKDNNLIEGEGRVAYINVNIELNKPDENIVDVRWAKGEYDENYFMTNASNGTNIKNTYNADKKYVFKVTQNGVYTVFAKDKHGRYKALQIRITGLGSDRLKFVLNWERSYDFDMHMKGFKNKSEVFHVFYSSKEYDSTYGKVILNRDNTSGGYSESDAEIIWLERAAKDTVYTCYIYKYGSSYTNAFATHKPTLKVYRGDTDAEAELIYDSTKVKDWSKTQDGSNRYWYILSYNANTREVELIDQYMNVDNYLPDTSKGGE